MNPLYHPVTPDETPIPPPTSPAPVDVFLELESLNSSSQASQNSTSQNQDTNASPSYLPSLKEARKVAIIIGVVIFLGIGKLNIVNKMVPLLKEIVTQVLHCEK